MGVLERNNRKRGMLLGEEGNSLVLLLAINAILFAFFNIIKAAYILGDLGTVDQYTSQVLNWWLVPGSVKQFASKPWTALTYMFTHEGKDLTGMFKLVSNMLWLWMFGYILQDVTGNRHIAPLYLYGGLAGALFFILSASALPSLVQGQASMLVMQGAGASVMAIAIACAILAPSYRIFPYLHGGIPVWVITLIFAGADFVLIASANTAVSLAHLAGGMAGMLYALRLKTGKDSGVWMHQLYHWFFNLFNPNKQKLAAVQEVRGEIFYQTGKRPAFQKKPLVTQQRIDDLLDKIHQQGFHQLSEEEKEYLRTASKEV